MSKEVVHAHLYESPHIVGLGELGKSLPPVGKTLKNLSMTLEDNGSLLVEWEVGNTVKSITIGAATVKSALHKDRTIAQNNPKPTAK